VYIFHTSIIIVYLGRPFIALSAGLVVPLTSIAIGRCWGTNIHLLYWYYHGVPQVAVRHAISGSCGTISIYCYW
jgi:hypothetical protein